MLTRGRSSARRTVINTEVASPNLNPNLPRLAVRGSSALDLTLQIFIYEAQSTGVPRHPYIPEMEMDLGVFEIPHA